MATLKAIIAGAGLLIMSATAAMAQNPYCDSYARDYANRTANVGGNVVGGALLGALAGAGIGSFSANAGKGAAIGAGVGAGLGAVGSSGEWQRAYNAAFQDCLARYGGGQPVATGNACDVGSQAWLNYCDGRPGIGRGGQFKSFNPNTGTYRGFDGLDHFCLPSYC
jgi:hypothetical protein